MKSEIIKQLLNENVIDSKKILDKAYELLHKDFSSKEIEKKVKKILKKSKTEKEALKRVEKIKALLKEKKTRDKKDIFSESVKFHLGYSEEKEPLNEGIRFFKSSKKIEGAIKDLRIKLNSGAEFTEEQEEFLNYTIDFSRKAKKVLEKLETKYAKETSKEEKMNLKKEYADKIKELRAVYFKANSYKRVESFFKSAMFPSYAYSLLIFFLLSPILGVVSYRILYRKIQNKKISKIELMEKIKNASENVDEPQVE